MELSHPGLIPLPEASKQMFGNTVCVAPTGDRCGEGPVWHEVHASVYWADINRFLILRFSPADQTVRSWFFDEPVTGLCLTDRFKGRLRDECLNANWFTSLSDARRKIETWRQDYNEQRPHSSLNYLPPAEFARTAAEMTA
jgi:transposase InsO family protein